MRRIVFSYLFFVLFGLSSFAAPSYETQTADFSKPADEAQWDLVLKQGMEGYDIPFNLVDGQSEGTNTPWDATGWTITGAMRKPTGVEAARITGVVSTDTCTFTTTSNFLASPVDGWLFVLVAEKDGVVVNQPSGNITILPSPEIDSGDLLLTRSVNIPSYTWFGEFSPTNLPLGEIPVVVDGVTITGDGTTGDPLVGIAGGSTPLAAYSQDYWMTKASTFIMATGTTYELAVSEAVLSNKGYFLVHAVGGEVTLTLPVVSELLAAGDAGAGKEFAFRLVGGAGLLTIVDQDGQGFSLELTDPSMQATVRLASNGLYQITQSSIPDPASSALLLYPVTEESLFTGKIPIWRDVLNTVEDSKWSPVQQSIATVINSDNELSPTLCFTHVVPVGFLAGDISGSPYSYDYKTERTSGSSDTTFWALTYKVDTNEVRTLVSTSSQEHQHFSSTPSLTTVKGTLTTNVVLDTGETIAIDFVAIKESPNSPTLTVYFEDESGTSFLLGVPSSAIQHSALGGRDVANSHPATAISHTPIAELMQTEVESALNYLATNKASLVEGNTFTGNQIFTGVFGHYVRLGDEGEADQGILYLSAVGTSGVHTVRGSFGDLRLTSNSDEIHMSGDRLTNVGTGTNDTHAVNKGQMDAAIIDTFQGMPENLGVSTNYQIAPTRYKSYASPTNDFVFNFVLSTNSVHIGATFQHWSYGAHAVTEGANVDFMNATTPTGTNVAVGSYNPITDKWDFIWRAL